MSQLITPHPDCLLVRREGQVQFGAREQFRRDRSQALNLAGHAITFFLLALMSGMRHVLLRAAFLLERGHDKLEKTVLLIVPLYFLTQWVLR